MTDKKMIDNYVKLMKAMAKSAKKRGSRLLTQRIANEAFGEIVYITDSCAGFPIPASVYDAHAVECKCPTDTNNVDIYKIIKNTDYNGRKVIPTRMLWELEHFDKTVRIFKSDRDYLFVDKFYTDLIELLPACLSGYSECKNEKDIYPVAFYNSDVDLGYVICPISTKAHEQGESFENCLHALEGVSYAYTE